MTSTPEADNIFFFTAPPGWKDRNFPVAESSQICHNPLIIPKTMTATGKPMPWKLEMEPIQQEI